MLFLYRPRQTWMPFGMPRGRTEQGAYNRDLQRSFESTRRVAKPLPSSETAPPATERDSIAQLQDLAQLHASGALSDAEFAAAKAMVLDAPEDSP